MKQGNYFGTEVDGKWWRRYRGAGFFARGNGELWIDEEGLHFCKTLTASPLTISWDEITAVRLAKWHAGRSALGRPVLKVEFQRDGRDLTAGFYLSRNWDEMGQLVEDLSRRMIGGGRERP